MKQILLAKKGKRMLARLIDFLIVTGLTLILFFGLIYPNVFNRDLYLENNEKIVNLYRESELFFVDSEGNYRANSTFEFKTIDDLYNTEVKVSNQNYEIKLTSSLYDYYTQKYKDFDGQNNLSPDIYKSQILKLGLEESNIRDYNEETHTFTLIDESKSDITLQFFIETYQNACVKVTESTPVKTLSDANDSLMIKSLSLIVPTLIGISFIFDLLIPLFMPYSETIGKKIMHLGLVSKDGYSLKKYLLIPRWLAYIFLEYLLGIVTFGGLFLISYTMFLFCKKRRCIHDFLSNSVVVDADNSIFFSNKEEEAFYINRQKARGINNETIG